VSLFGTTNTTTRFLQGNEACVEGALAAGCRFFGGYPITPSTEIAEGMAKRLPGLGGKFIQMEDEIAGLGAVIGASLAGVKSLTATSGPGFSLKQEHIGFAAMAEVPCVIINVQRGGPSTGLPTLPAQGDVMQARWGTHGDHPSIVLAPTSVKECFDLTIKAFNLSEKLRTPVILLSDEVIAHMREKIELPPTSALKIIDRKKPGFFVNKKNYKPYAAKDNEPPTMANYGEGFRFNVTGLIHDETGFPSSSPEITEKLIYRLHKKIEAAYKDIRGSEITLPQNCRAVILSYGSTFRTAKRAALDANIGYVKLTTIWPFPEQEIRELARKVDIIFVAEMNLGQLRLEVERVAGGLAKVIGINSVNGQLMKPRAIFEEIKSHGA